MKKTNKTLAMALGLCLSTSGLAAGSSTSDTFIQGFETYAQELKSFSDDTTTQHSVESYAQEVKNAIRSVGYIGPKLSLPKPVKVAEGVYTIVGSLIWHTPQNYGLNNNLTFIELEDGVFVFNAGPNTAVASAFHGVIKEHTNKPVKWVAVENSQGHAYLGASYWVDQGVKNLYSHSVANRDYNNAYKFIKASWARRTGHELVDPSRNVSDKFTTFEDKLVIDVGGGETVEILNFGPGHTPGSTIVYLPKRNIVLPGDLAYNHRMLALFSYTNTFQWAESFEAFMDAMPKDVIVIPGHGGPTDMATVKRDTYDYLKYMHAEVKKVIDAGGTEIEVEQIDQSAYKHRSVYNETHRQNAVHVYKEMSGGDLGQSYE